MSETAAVPSPNPFSFVFVSDSSSLVAKLFLSYVTPDSNDHTEIATEETDTDACQVCVHVCIRLLNLANHKSNTEKTSETMLETA